MIRMCVGEDQGIEVVKAVKIRVHILHSTRLNAAVNEDPILPELKQVAAHPHFVRPPNATSSNEILSRIVSGRG